MTPENENLLTFGEKVFSIPESGGIERRGVIGRRTEPNVGYFSPEMTEETIPIKTQIGGYATVKLTYIPRTDIEYNLLIVWVAERNEWIEIDHCSWVESSLIPHEESASGPWTLEEVHAKKIMEAFGVKQILLPFEKIRNTSPEKLEDFARKQKI